MSINTKSNYGLESVHKSMISSSVLSIALINVWNVRKHNSLSTNFFKSKKFILKPLKHISWIFEVQESCPIELVANIRVQRDHFSFSLSKFLSFAVFEWKREISPVSPKFDLFWIFNKLIPSWCPFLNSFVLSWGGHFNDILRIGIMISNAWDYFNSVKTFRHLFSDVLHDGNIRFEI